MLTVNFFFIEVIIAVYWESEHHLNLSTIFWFCKHIDSQIAKQGIVLHRSLTKKRNSSLKKYRRVSTELLHKSIQFMPLLLSL